MLVEKNTSLEPAQIWLRGVWVSLVVLVLSVVSLAPYLTNSMELVRIRNALLLMDGGEQKFDWNPYTPPPDFVLEKGVPYPVFVEAATKLGLREMNSDWDRATAISRHLLSYPELKGPPIQSNLLETYRRIISHGEGYCSDFSRVFMAFAIAEGIPVRAWSFSLDGFGGHGHMWPEIWNRQLGRWQLVDIYNNFYFHGKDGIAISALELRHALLNSPLSVQRAPLHPGARLGYQNEDMLWDYYRRGLPGWYMQWGNDVFSYDRVILAHGLGYFSRSLEQLDAIVSGVSPRVNLMLDETNREDVRAMWRLRTHLFAVTSIDALALLALIVCLAGWFHAKRHSPCVNKS